MIRKKPGGPASRAAHFLRGSGVAAATAVLTGQATLGARRGPGRRERAQGPLRDGRDHAQGQRPGSLVLGRAPQHPARHPAPPAGRDRPQAGLRSRQLRRLHGDHRRRSGLFLHHAGRLVPGQDDPDPGELRHRRTGVPHAFHQNDGLMCGYCTPGFVTACKASWTRTPTRPSTRSRRGSTATSAAAALTSASCKRRWPRPKP